jgi:splicing factor 3B subunit 3
MEGMVAISANTLRIFVLEQLGELFNQTVLPLTYTPRKLEINPQNNHLYILESDHNSFTFQERQRIKQALKIDDDLENELTEAKIGVPQAGTGRWASCIRIVDPIKVISIYERI